MFFFKRSIPYRQGYPIVSYLIRKSIYTYTFESHFHRFNKTIFIKIHTVDTNLPVIRSCIAQRMTMINNIPLVLSRDLNHRMMSRSCTHFFILL